MKNSVVGSLAFFAALGTVCFLCHPASAQSGAVTTLAKPSRSANAPQPSGEQPCIGCSVDGKATPRTPDGHPDLSGFWDNPFKGVVVDRPDGSHGFFLGVNGNGAAAPPPPEKSEPSYKPEYAAKVHAINRQHLLWSHVPAGPAAAL